MIKKLFRIAWVFFLLPYTVSAKTYIFVSYSMPDHALQAYHTQAQKEGSTLVMRGLKDDSFLETQKEAQRLKITYDINPDLFEEYGVTRAPTIVIQGDKNDTGVSSKISGHISLETARSVLKEIQE